MKKNSLYQSRSKFHIVRRGENLAVIAQKYQVTVGDLRTQNKIRKNSHLFVGARLIIPSAEAKSYR